MSKIYSITSEGSKYLDLVTLQQKEGKELSEEEVVDSDILYALDYIGSQDAEFMEATNSSKGCYSPSRLGSSLRRLKSEGYISVQNN